VGVEHFGISIVPQLGSICSTVLVEVVLYYNKLYKKWYELVLMIEDGIRKFIFFHTATADKKICSTVPKLWNKPKVWNN